MPDPQNAPKNTPESDLTSRFNQLSWASRRQLQTAALFGALTANMRDDVHAHPWKYPAYVLYLSAMAASVASPVPGIPLAMGGVAAAWAKMGWTPGAQLLNKRLKDAFDPANLIRAHEAYLSHQSGKPDGVKSAALALATVRRTCGDFGATTQDAFGRLRHMTHH